MEQQALVFITLLQFVSLSVYEQFVSAIGKFTELKKFAYFTLK
jgi:uncharacterized membrane protein YqhA